MILVHASILEIVWLLFAAVCVTVTMVNVLSARVDKIKTANSPIPVQVYMTRAIYTSTRIVLAVKTLILLAAIWAVFKPPPPPDIWTLPQSLANVMTWICVTILLTIHASLSMMWRNKLGEFGRTNGGRRSTDAVIAKKVENIELKAEEIKDTIVEKANEIKESIAPLQTTVDRVDKAVNGLAHDNDGSIQHE